MTDPLFPPPELVQQWRNAAPTEPGSIDREHWLIDKAAQWGADQELEACCEWLEQQRQRSVPTPDLPATLRAARRPKPPSLKEQALKELDRVTADLAFHNEQYDVSAIRRALEQLSDD